MKNKLKKILIIMQPFIITMSTFFTIYIPLMFGNFIFLHKMILYNCDIVSSLFIFCIIAFGLIWIAIYISGKITYFFNDLYKWDEKYKNLKQR